MKSQSFGQYLVSKGLITESEHKIALHIQSKNRLLGEIAIETGYLARDDIPVIMEFMERNPDIRFGEAAVSLGLLNTHQLRYLLDIRTRRKVRIGDILLKEKFIDQESLHAAVMGFDQKRKRLRSVLIADESRTVLNVLEHMLKKYGYEVARANQGKAALEIISNAKPDIFICGGLLPDVNGIDLCDRLVSNTDTYGVNIILMSSDDSRSSVERAFEIGVSHFLKKPLREQELINVIYEIERNICDKRPEKILIVDDSKGARQVISRELASAGFQIHLSENGQEALKKARALKPDLVTMDLVMPVMDGFEACRKLKEMPETNEAPVIIISGSSSAKIRAKGFEAGAVEYFTKPFKAGRLADFISLLFETKKIRRSERILVVEDNDVTRHIFKYIFTKNGFNVYSARNADEAVGLLEKCDPDLVVTDCYMPVKDGFEFTKEIKRMERFRHVPVIMVTSSEKSEDILKGLASGASDYITKPFNESELLARANAHLLNKKLIENLYQEQEALKASEESFRALTEASFEGVAIIRDDRIIEVNQAFRDIFGLGEDKLIDMHFEELVDPAHHEVIRNNLSAGFAGNLEVTGVRSDGSRRYLEVHIKNITYKGNDARVTTVWDITERKQTEIQLLEAKEKAEQATKLKDKFVSLVAHDLRTPFSSILGLMSLFKSDGAGSIPDDMMKIVDSVMESGDRMVKMIDELLDISRLQTGKIAPQPVFFDGHKQVASVISAFKNAAERKGLVVSNDVPPGTRLYADYTLLGQVIGNLVANAIKFSERGGEISVFVPDGRCGVIAVKDTGVGIDETILSDLFRHDVKTTSEGTAGEKGTGLGLVYSNDIMKAHDGYLEVKSKAGEGSVFYAVLPVKRPKVLLVDDEPAILSKLEKLVQSLDAVTITARNGMEALATLESDNCHLILTGLDMPVMDGLTFLETIKSSDNEKCKIPVIAMTSDNKATTREHAFQAGADDFVAKPFADEDLIPRVKKFIV